MQNLFKSLSMSVLVGIAALFSGQGYASVTDDSLLFSDQAAEVLGQDACARGATEGAANELVMIAMDLGGDIPEEIWVERIEVEEAETSYRVTIAEYKFLVAVDSECRAVSVTY